MAAPKKKNYQGGTNRSTGPKSKAQTPRQMRDTIYRGLPPVAAGDKEGARIVQQQINRRAQAANANQYGRTPKPRKGTGGRR